MNNTTTNNNETTKPMTTKRLKHLERQSKKIQYTKEERKTEIDKCKVKLSELGLGEEYPHEDVIKVYDIMNDYIENGKASSGTIPLTGINRVFCYYFPLTKKNEISTCLKYDENV
jgi:hypothetical protein